MEHSINNLYLHKKFKKQLNIVVDSPKPYNNESKSGILEPCEEKTTLLLNNEKEPYNNTKYADECVENVPKQSTNQTNILQFSPSFINFSSTKSSISATPTTAGGSNLQQQQQQQQQSSCISYVVANNIRNIEDKSSSKPPEPISSFLRTTTTTTTTTSSILGNLYSSSVNKEEPSPQQPPQPDKALGGKYVCPYCNLACSKPSVLQKHIRAHTNERPYPCDSCGFSFKTRSNLYKHCRSRTHANRVMGNKVQLDNAESNELEVVKLDNDQEQVQGLAKNKPYKPRFHTKHFFNASVIKENIQDERVDDSKNSNLLSEHINDIISKNNSIVNNSEMLLLKKKTSELLLDNNNEYLKKNDVCEEPLNLSSKNRKRCLSEVMEPVVQKSLIKELLLKNLSSDMQCPHCKMIFQTVTELELHKLRSCKGFVKPGAKYSRSSSVNVASILTQNKNAFDNIPQMQNVYPLKSPGPFLGKTQLVDIDKPRSFSFDDALPGVFPMSRSMSMNLEKRSNVKLFGGEVKITQTSGETKSFKIDNKDDKFTDENYEYGAKLSENRVVKSGLQSGGTVLTNKATYQKAESSGPPPDIIRVYENTSVSPSIDLDKAKFSFEERPISEAQNDVSTSQYKYTNIMDFSQKAVKLLTPNIKQPSLAPTKFTFDLPPVVTYPKTPPSPLKPMNLVVDGKVVRYVPGMPGPVATAEVLCRNIPKKPSPLTISEKPQSPTKPKLSEKPHVKPLTLASSTETKKFARPNSLALKPTTASLKQHHGLTPTMFNQILISPDTPRVAKKYMEHFLHGNYFSYLGLKCSTKPVYCTLNKTQPFYVPHFQKLSMYSEWRQQNTKTDKLYVSAYDSRQKRQKYTTAGKTTADLIVHSSYKFKNMGGSEEKNDDGTKSTTILGGYECNEDYTYIRGRGRGRYVCDQCGIRCKKPSMLKKHIRTHSNDRPYTCNHCNFSFKTKGNLTKHMKSKAHTKNYAASGSGSSTQQSGTQSSESDTEDSGMDSSDESTRREEHEAAYGLLSLSQKTTQQPMQQRDSDSPINLMDTDEIAHVYNRNYAKNKTMDEKPAAVILTTAANLSEPFEVSKDDFHHFLGKSSLSRPLTYPYTSVLHEIQPKLVDNTTEEAKSESLPKCIKQFHVIQKYASVSAPVKKQEPISESVKNDDASEINAVVPPQPPILKVNDAIVMCGDKQNIGDFRKRQLHIDLPQVSEKRVKNDEVMDLSMPTEKQPEPLRFNGSPHKNSDSNKPNGIDVNYVRNNEFNIPINYIQGETKQQTNNFVKPVEYDNSAMETLADIATKQVKLEKNTMAKSVASEFLKIATKHEYQSGDVRDSNLFGANKEVNELIVKPEGSKNCHICTKSFSKVSQLRLHMNIHYLERPFRCHSCSVSFRTKGHLQKHERSASHHNKLSSSPALSSSEPRPFKCIDCSIAFRIHGHLAKHLRSKMHIMKLECLAKIPFGLYAELERSNSLLTEINTADGDQCLESLKTLAKKVFINDPSKLNQLNSMEHIDTDS